MPSKEDWELERRLRRIRVAYPQKQASFLQPWTTRAMESTMEYETKIAEQYPCNLSDVEAVVQELVEKSSQENIEITAVNEASVQEQVETKEDKTHVVEKTGETVDEKTVISEVNEPNRSEEKSEVLPAKNELENAIDEQELKYWNAVNENPQDFTSWTYLLQFVEQENKLNSARKAFDAFLSRYPFCYGYWKKYADIERKNGELDRANEVFEKGVETIALSVDLWVHYLNFTSQMTKGQSNSSTAMRGLFERAIYAAGEDFRSDKLWDAYIEWEKSQKQLQNVTALYDRVLTVPTQNYSKHWAKFQNHINTNPLEDTLMPEELLKFKAEVGAAPPGFEVATTAEASGEENTATDGTATTQEAMTEVAKAEDAGNIEICKKVIAQRKVLYDANEAEVSKRWTFEEGVKRPYFHVKPLEKVQLKNWRDYLDFEVSTGNHHRVVILFERCVIACALYEEFWQRFASYMEVHDRVESCQYVYQRACYVHLPRKPDIHLAWAAFEEKHGNREKAREILERLDMAVPGLIYVKLRRTNLERRSNEIPKACAIFEQAIQETSDTQLMSFYSIKYAKLLTKIAKNIDKAREVLKAALEKDKDNKRLYLQLLDLELTMAETNEEKIDEVFDLVKTSGLSENVKESFSQRHLEYLEDFSCNIVKITKAREAHNKLYKSKTHLSNGKKRPNEEGSDAAVKVAKTEETTNTSHYNNVQYDATADYSAAAYTNPSTYNYNTAQWPGYATAQQPGYNYSNWYQQYGQAYAQ